MKSIFSLGLIRYHVSGYDRRDPEKRLDEDVIAPAGSLPIKDVYVQQGYEVTDVTLPDAGTLHTVDLDLVALYKESKVSEIQSRRIYMPPKNDFFK